MNKQGGFTLIELLAVIVILAIIAVIAVPIVLNIIDETKSNATLRSADFYLDAVEMAVANSTLKEKNITDGVYNILSSGNVCLEYTGTTCTDELTVEVNGDVPDSGSITITSGAVSSIQLVYDGKTIVQDEKGKLVYQTGETIEKGKLSSVCKPAEEQLYTTNQLEAGYKYECKVDPNKPEYTFYVLTTPTSTDTSINLIMDSNIREGGEAVKEANPTTEQEGRVAWYAGGEDASYGPITAMDYLQDATKDWTNTNTQTVDKFTVCNDGGNCTYKEMSKIYTTYARMPYYSELSDYSEDTNNAYLYDNLALYCSKDGNPVSCDVATSFNGVYAEGIGHVNNIYGYWILSDWDGFQVWAIDAINSGARRYSGYFTNMLQYGVRPVINLNL